MKNTITYFIKRLKLGIYKRIVKNRSKKIKQERRISKGHQAVRTTRFSFSDGAKTLLFIKK